MREWTKTHRLPYIPHAACKKAFRVWYDTYEEPLRKTVGIRVPDAPIPLAIIEALGNPIATTSAALPDGELIPDPWTLQDLYGHSVDIIVDGGYLREGNTGITRSYQTKQAGAR